MSICVVIPAYQPERRLVEVARGVRALRALPVIVVDDGSGPDYAGVFDEVAALPGVTLVRHAVNLGKGAALRTGFNAALVGHADLAGVVTADADGQHDPEDIVRIAAALEEQPDALVLGVRGFDGEVPLRSRVGNRLSGWAYRALVGESLADTQTGLRGVPAQLLPNMLRSQAPGYEFELDALILARHKGFRLVQVRIRTIYENQNATSHFNPLRDSMRISLVLFRFGLVAFCTALLDNATFLLAYALTGSIVPSQLLGRLVAGPFNYLSARRAVFISGEPHRFSLPRYVALVALAGVASYGLITVLSGSMSVFRAKLLAETIVFFANFLIQRDWVFRGGRQRAAATDWDAYYASPTPTAHLTRRYTTAVLVETLRRYALAQSATPEIVEIGGANSGFIDPIARVCHPRLYHVVDSNAYGLELLRQRRDPACPLALHQADIRKFQPEITADAVFSIGLVEHFDRADTRAVIRAHFDLVREGGCVVISFPTPTWLYRAARAGVEAIGRWRFHDERPLGREEVLEAVGERGILREERVLWPIVFTQRLMVFERVEGE